jgi:colicin import membrane protein
MKTLREYMNILEDISRRGFLKGAGAAAGLAAAGGALAQTDAVPSSEPVLNYGGKIVAAIRPHLRPNKKIDGNPSVEYDVYLDPSGTIIDIKLRKASGNDYWDAVAENALLRTKRLPRDDNGRVPSPMTIALSPK